MLGGIDEGWSLDLAGIEAAFASGARAMVLCNPHNPLGYVPPAAELAALADLAEAHGATGVRLTDKATLVDDLRAALATPGSVVVDARVTREENVYPMIAPGAAARDMVG